MPKMVSKKVQNRNAVIPELKKNEKFNGDDLFSHLNKHHLELKGANMEVAPSAVSNSQSDENGPWQLPKLENLEAAHPKPGKSARNG